MEVRLIAGVDSMRKETGRSATAGVACKLGTRSMGVRWARRVTKKVGWAAAGAALLAVSCFSLAIVTSCLLDGRGPETSVGAQLRKEGLKPGHPVVIVPGFITTGLEVEATSPCTDAFLRSGARVHGGYPSIYYALRNMTCMTETLALDPATGQDSASSAVLRPMTGPKAVDEFLPGMYPVFKPMLDSLTDLGYNEENLAIATYDWRLSPQSLDYTGYVERLRITIEGLVKRQGRKVVLIGHSWGDNVSRFALATIEANHPGWCEAHIRAQINIAGPTLGAPKALTPTLSGDLSDIPYFSLRNYIADWVVSRSEAALLFRSWGASHGLLPTGGIEVWGDVLSAPDDLAARSSKNSSFGSIITATAGDADKGFDDPAKLLEQDAFSIDAAVELLAGADDAQLRANVARWSATDSPTRRCGVGRDGDGYFSPLSCPLPAAPSMSYMCFYGVGKDTERAYGYTGTPGKGGVLLDVHYSDGDGTVPLLSLGTLCNRHWRDKRLNPAGMRVVTREYVHTSDKPADHVNILGNEDIIRDIITEAAGHGALLQDIIVSPIADIAAKVPLTFEEEVSTLPVPFIDPRLLRTRTCRAPACREPHPGPKLSKKSIPNSTMFVDPFAPIPGLNAHQHRAHRAALPVLPKLPRMERQGSTALAPIPQAPAPRECLCPPGIKLSKESIPNSTMFVDPFAPTLGLDAELTRQHGARCAAFAVLSKLPRMERQGSTALALYPRAAARRAPQCHRGPELVKKFIPNSTMFVDPGLDAALLRQHRAHRAAFAVLPKLPQACREPQCYPGIKLSKESIPNSTMFVDPFASIPELHAEFTTIAAPASLYLAEVLVSGLTIVFIGHKIFGAERRR